MNISSNPKNFTEHPIRLLVNGSYCTSFMCTPQSLTELGVGHMAALGHIGSIDDVLSCTVTPDLQEIRLNIRGNANKQPYLASELSQRATNDLLVNKTEFGTSYGLQPTSTEPYDKALKTHKRIHTTGYDTYLAQPALDSLTQLPCPDSAVIFPLPLLEEAAERMVSEAVIYQESGGVHSAAIGNADTLICCEDVGRCNAVDKVLGSAILQNVPIASSFVIVTGRIAYEMFAKIACARVPVLASLNIPSNFAIAAAQKTGTTLIGKILHNAQYVYTSTQRVSYSVNTGANTVFGHEQNCSG